MKQPFLSDDEFFKSTAIDDGGNLIKAAGHKYYKRTGVKGSYKYYYTKQDWERGKAMAGERKSDRAEKAFDRRDKAAQDFWTSMSLESRDKVLMRTRFSTVYNSSDYNSLPDAVKNELRVERKNNLEHGVFSGLAKELPVGLYNRIDLEGGMPDEENTKITLTPAGDKIIASYTSNGLTKKGAEIGIDDYNMIIMKQGASKLQQADPGKLTQKITGREILPRKPYRKIDAVYGDIEGREREADVGKAILYSSYGSYKDHGGGMKAEEYARVRKTMLSRHIGR